MGGWVARGGGARKQARRAPLITLALPLPLNSTHLLLHSSSYPPIPSPIISGYVAEGAGDLLDDFVLAATDQGPAAASHGEHSSEQGDEYSVLDSEEEEEGQEEDYTGSSTASSGDPGAQLLAGEQHSGALQGAVSARQAVLRHQA